MSSFKYKEFKPFPARNFIANEVQDISTANKLWISTVQFELKLNGEISGQHCENYESSIWRYIISTKEIEKNR